MNYKLYILHGWAHTLDKWQPFINLLKQTGFEVNILKIPGLTEDLHRIWTIEDYVSWLKKIIDKEKGEVILVGHSNGGRIALAFTNLFPEKVDKLILINSAGIYHNELPLRIKRAVFKTISKIGKKLSSSEKLKHLLYKIVGESDYRNATPVMKQTMINLINSDKSLKLENIQIPTLIIWGGEDKITPLSDGLLINKLIKNSKLEIIKDARHSPMFTNAKEVAQLVQQFNNKTL